MARTKFTAFKCTPFDILTLPPAPAPPAEPKAAVESEESVEEESVEDALAALASATFLSFPSAPGVMVRLLGDDPFSAVCLCLDARSLDALRACCQRCRVVASADAAWEPRCAARWAGRRQCEAWLAAASDAPPAAWRAAFVAREREITRRRVPVFAMGAYLELGRRCDLHFFEPRYKWLVQEALHAHGGVFVFCTAAPVANPNSPAFSWVAEIRR